MRRHLLGVLRLYHLRNLLGTRLFDGLQALQVLRVLLLGPLLSGNLLGCIAIVSQAQVRFVFKPLEPLAN